MLVDDTRLVLTLLPALGGSSLGEEEDVSTCDGLGTGTSAADRLGSAKSHDSIDDRRALPTCRR
jgi:hypothetical protein